MKGGEGGKKKRHKEEEERKDKNEWRIKKEKRKDGAKKGRPRGRTGKEGE